VAGKFAVSASQYDSFQLYSNIGDGPPYNAAHLAYAEMLRVRTASVMRELNATAAAFSPACFGA